MGVAGVVRLPRISGESAKVLAARVQRVEGEVDELFASHASLKGDVSRVVLDMATVKADTAQILAVLNAARGIGGFVDKHFPRAMAFALGLAVAGGWINPEIAAFVRAFFGLQ